MLPETTRSRISDRLRPRANSFIPPTLTAHNRNLKQRAFLCLKDREVFYGGAAGGAKTSGILAAALQYVDVPHYHALLLRQNFKQLSQPGSWIPMAHEWLDSTPAHYHEGRKEWRFPSGATLTFGFVNQGMTDDVRKYETANFSFIGIDELTGWNEANYRFLFSRLRRRAGSNVPTRMRSASNPGGRGHEWVKRRFVDPATRRATAMFLEAKLPDNPYLDQQDYIESLKELHPTHWRRLLFGDWSVANPGELFQPRLWLDAEEDFLDEAPAADLVAKTVRYWDLAAAEPTAGNPDPDYTAGARISRLRTGLYVWEHMVRVRTTPAKTEKIVASTSTTDGRACTQWFEQVPGAGAALAWHYRHNVFPEWVIAKADTAWSGKAKAARARPVAAIMEKRKMKFVRGPWNDPLFDELEAFSEDPQHSGAHDDQVDGGSGAFSKVMRRVGPATVGQHPRGSIPR